MGAMQKIKPSKGSSVNFALMNNQNKKNDRLINKKIGKANPAQERIGLVAGFNIGLYAVNIKSTTNKKLISKMSLCIKRANFFILIIFYLHQTVLFSLSLLSWHTLISLTCLKFDLLLLIVVSFLRCNCSPPLFFLYRLSS